MAARDAILALLLLGPCYGNQLASEYLRRTGEPLNPGQVASTLTRLEREGAVRALPREPGGRIPYELTPAGRGLAETWLAVPDGHPEAELLLAASLPGAHLPALVAAQRAALDRGAEVLIALRAAQPYGLAAVPKRGRRARHTE